MSNRLRSYVLITPARNEADFIEKTIQSVTAQSVLPRKWVIVSDGSTDGTDEIVQRYAAQFSWMELVSMPARRERHFAGKVHAFLLDHALQEFLPDAQSRVLGKTMHVIPETLGREGLLVRLGEMTEQGGIAEPLPQGAFGAGFHSPIESGDDEVFADGQSLSSFGAKAFDMVDQVELLALTPERFGQAPAKDLRVQGGTTVSGDGLDDVLEFAEVFLPDTS